jgi:hypothetical protein
MKRAARFGGLPVLILGQKRRSRSMNRMIYEAEPEDPAVDRAVSEPELWGRDQNDSNVRSWPLTKRAGPESPAEDSELMYRLVVVALALASSQLEIRIAADRKAICTSCGEEAPVGAAFRHRPECLSAEVIRIIAQLKERGSLELNPKGREDATPGNDASAGDGNRSRFAFREPWTYRAGSEPGTFAVVDRDGCMRALVSGRFVDRLGTAERIASCVNFCTGNSTELLGKLKAAAEGTESEGYDH